jgi:hypothetical protein
VEAYKWKKSKTEPCRLGFGGRPAQGLVVVVWVWLWYVVHRGGDENAKKKKKTKGGGIPRRHCPPSLSPLSLSPLPSYLSPSLLPSYSSPSPSPLPSCSSPLSSPCPCLAHHCGDGGDGGGGCSCSALWWVQLLGCDGRLWLWLIKCGRGLGLFR